MQIPIEISRPHYHPGKSFDMKVTKKRDLSIPPNWVANERIEKDGVSYAIVMPPRDKELYEIEQEPHIHLSEYVFIKINGGFIRAKVKLGPDEFDPKVHFDDITAKELGITSGMEATL